MPNWCVQNSILKGPKEDITRFCNLVNSLYDNPQNKPNGFGDLWLGNLFIAMGGKPEDINIICGLRGNIDPDGDTMATLFYPEPKKALLKPNDYDDGNSAVYFSVTTAWGPSQWFNDMIGERFPNCKYGWKATDEFGNFHVGHNLDLLGVKRYGIDWEYELFYDYGEEDAVAAALNDILDAFVGENKIDPLTAADILSPEKKLYDRIKKYNDKENHDRFNYYLSFTLWEES